MPIRVKHSISSLFVDSALTAKWVSATPDYNMVRFDIRETVAHNWLAEAL